MLSTVVRDEFGSFKDFKNLRVLRLISNLYGSRYDTGLWSLLDLPAFQDYLSASIRTFELHGLTLYALNRAYISRTGEFTQGAGEPWFVASSSRIQV